MVLNETVCSASFRNSGEAAEIKLGDLISGMTQFLANYGTEYLLGDAFSAIIGNGDGVSRFVRLLKATGYTDDPAGFCSELIGQLESTDSTTHEPIRVNKILMPHLFLMSVMELLLPGNRFISIKTVDELETLTNCPITDDQRGDMQAVIDTYPVRLSMHTIRQMRISRDVAYQYLPFAEELDLSGHTNTWIGQFHQGVLEQMYQNRVIFLLNMTCPVYCRFCFRKHKESRNETNPTVEEVHRAVEHVADSPKIKEIVITGGDPFLNRANLAAAIDGLMAVPHVQTLRLATRAIAYYPHLFQANAGSLLEYVKLKNRELQQKGKRMEVATHFIHPDEISPDALDIISNLVSNGIPVYVQTPFLANCNDQGPELARLFNLLRGAGAELHYIYIPCSPIHGNSIYWTPISKGLAVAHYLRAHLSDRIIPRICTATQIGKMDWHTSGWAIKPDADNDHFFWIRTPYTPDYFNAFAPIANELDIIAVNDEGTIDIRYMAQIGDTELFLGSRKLSTPKKEPPLSSGALETLQDRAVSDQSVSGSIVSTGVPGIFRLHETRAAVDVETAGADLDYIRNHLAITDVVFASRTDALENLDFIAERIHKLKRLSHVNSVRLRSVRLNHTPELFTWSVIDRLGDLNDLSIASPQRLEIETQFLDVGEIRPEHGVLIRDLSNRGITVYNNTPLLTGVNDSPEAIHALANGLREIGAEFHHLYVAGTGLQQYWNIDRPIDVACVIDIASRVRKDGSGREIPRYIIKTELGEVDFGLTSRLSSSNGRIRVELKPYDLKYYQEMEPQFVWPEGIDESPDGHPQVRVHGLIDTGGFMVF